MTTVNPKKPGTCIFPPCGKAWLDDKVQLCTRHKDMAELIIWSLDHITLVTGKTIGQMLMEIPIIAAAVTELINKGKSGLIVPPSRPISRLD